MRVSIMGGESVTNTGVNVGENQIKATATLGKALAFDFFFFLAMASPFELLLRGTKSITISCLATWLLSCFSMKTCLVNFYISNNITTNLKYTIFFQTY